MYHERIINIVLFTDKCVLSQCAFFQRLNDKYYFRIKEAFAIVLVDYVENI